MPVARRPRRRATGPSASGDPCPLEWALAYENDDVVHKFRERWALSAAEARRLFTETKRWLWLAAYLQRERAMGGSPCVERLSIDGPLVMLDEMWHTFILFTREYTEYCQSRFGHYMHHAPSTRAERQRQRRDQRRAPRRAREREAERMRRQYRYVLEKLGEGALREWYGRYPRRYTPDFMRRVRIS